MMYSTAHAVFASIVGDGVISVVGNGVGNGVVTGAVVTGDGVTDDGGTGNGVTRGSLEIQ